MFKSMLNELHYETVTSVLQETLSVLMTEKLFAPFRLVGGTNLSLRYGHRRSDDIDLFTDAPYGSLDFRTFEKFLRSCFPYYDCTAQTSIVAFGCSYYVGRSADECVKLDLMYTDPFIEESDLIDGIRMANVKDIVAMKMDVVSRGGRKKDFWDLHFLLTKFSLEEMCELHGKRYPWGDETALLMEKFTDFQTADSEPNPICLLGKDWDEIKLDLMDEMESR